MKEGVGQGTVELSRIAPIPKLMIVVAWDQRMPLTVYRVKQILKSSNDNPSVIPFIYIQVNKGDLLLR
jgi:hypothetical protein